MSDKDSENRIMANIRWAGRQKIANAPAKNILNAIATYANRAGVAYPSQRELAVQTGYSERAVRMALAFLAGDNPDKAKFIERRERRRGNGSRTSDELRLLINGNADHRQEVPVVSADEVAATGTTCRAPRNLMPTSPARDSGPTTFEQPGEQPKDHSGPDGPAPQGGASQPNFTRELFDRGTGELVRMTNRPPDQARALIGYWRQIAGDDATVLAAIDAAVAAGAVIRDPAPWIEGRIRRQRDESPRRSKAPASPAVTAGRAVEAMRMAERGEWPIGGTVRVEADSPEGEAWAKHYARFGVSPKWIDGGWRMPSLRPPASAEA